MKKFLLSLALLMMLGFGNATPVEAEQISSQQAAAIAQARFEGRVIAVEQESQDDTLIYKVKVLDRHGGMHIVIIDANSGQILSAH